MTNYGNGKDINDNVSNQIVALVRSEVHSYMCHQRLTVKNI